VLAKHRVAGLNLRRLEFTLTTRCNSECIYCQAEASPLKNEVMDVEDALNYLAEACAVSKLESFMVFGGEPMLFPSRAISMFEKASRLDVPKIAMMTNGIWGKNKRKAEELAIKLKASGLNNLRISVDAFHLQFIPLEYPRNAALASVAAGIQQVAWNVAVVESLDSANEYDKKTAEILRTLEPAGIDAHTHRIIPVGRATSNLQQYLKKESLQGPCTGDPILENALMNPECITIEPSGEVNICWNLTIGNAKEKPLGQIIREYDWRKNPIIRTLVEEGPMGLVRNAGRGKFRFQEDQYVNKCHLCIEIRKTIKNS
jgi:MoaA/NifB/PqqE/SkfB family radical SAM enzyme